MHRLATLLAVMIAAPVAAGDIVVFRCTAADGSVTLQDTPCAAGQVQDQRRYETPPPPPPLPPPDPVLDMPEPEPPQPTVSEPEPEPIELVEVPPLYECRSFDGREYVSEQGDGNRRCVPLAVTRIGYAPRPESATACEWVVDDCRLLDAEAACANWQRRHREAVRAEREAFSDTLAASRGDLARLQAIRDAACAR